MFVMSAKDVQIALAFHLWQTEDLAVTGGKANPLDIANVRHKASGIPSAFSGLCWASRLFAVTEFGDSLPPDPTLCVGEGVLGAATGVADG